MRSKVGAVVFEPSQNREHDDMGKEYQEIDEHMRGWMERQRVFFVSTAPLADDGRINCSPKGLDGLRVLGPRQIVYADIGGSGIETVAHLKENGRIVIMLCAFDGPPKIFRFYGHGRSVEPHDADFEKLVPMFPKIPAIRNFIIIDINCIRDSCGYGVPLYDFKTDRESLKSWCESKTEEEILTFRIERNALSLDGLPGLDIGPGKLSTS
ncbi:MAG: pyridoxamine 5'-phosphate oxidase family protein [Gammaproteobacteria bacterium]|nr:pyridoxamine 5'-phosphate oxidase family protein [Gammaproteobacteria bacterium]